jgi:hypothetical protein
VTKLFVYFRLNIESFSFSLHTLSHIMSDFLHSFSLSLCLSLSSVLLAMAIICVGDLALCPNRHHAMTMCPRTLCVPNEKSRTFRPSDNASLGRCGPRILRLLDMASLTNVSWTASRYM